MRLDRSTDGWQFGHCVCNLYREKAFGDTARPPGSRDHHLRRHTPPWQPVYLLVGQQVDKEIIDNMVHQMGLDRPLPEQYLRYLMAVARGDLGISR